MSRVYTEGRGAGREGRAIEVSVESFTTPGTHYTVRLYEGGSTCTCKAATHGKGCTKHVAEAKTRRRAEGAPAHHAEYIHELCKRVFAKPRKGESASRSYELLLEVYGYRYRVPELEAAAHARHEIVSGRVFGTVAA